MRAEGMISLVNPRRVISASKKGAIPLVTTSRKAISLGKGTSFQNRFEAKLPRREATQTRSYPESRIYTIPWRTYSNPEAELKAKLNSTTMAMFAFHIPSVKVVQSILESEPVYCRLTKTLKVVLLTL